MEAARQARSDSLAAIVDRLVAEYPDRPRAALERIAAEAWALFSGSRNDETLRMIAAEWYARTQLEPGSVEANDGDSPAA